MKISEIRELTDAEIQERIDDEREMLQKMYFNHAITEIESPAKIRMSKRTIAQMLTVVRERELEQQSNA